MSRRSNEPVVWLLFGAGGVVAAVALPAMVLVTGLLGPTGLLGEGALAYERVAAFAGHGLGKLVLLALLVPPMWLAAHRIHHTLHDLGLRSRAGPSAAACYGLALAGSLTAVVALLGLG